MRIVIQQGPNFIDGNGVANSSPFGAVVALVTDVAKAHDFKTKQEAEDWMRRKSISGKILEIEDGE